MLLRGVGTLRYAFQPNASVQCQPDGLTSHTKKWFLGAGFLGAPPISLIEIPFLLSARLAACFRSALGARKQTSWFASPFAVRPVNIISNVQELRALGADAIYVPIPWPSMCPQAALPKLVFVDRHSRTEPIPFIGKGANGVSTNGVTANSMLFDRGTFWVFPLTYFYLPKVPGRTFGVRRPSFANRLPAFQNTTL